MRYIKGKSRKQCFMPTTLDEWVSEDSFVRSVDDFVNKLNLKEMQFTHTEFQKTGRPPYNPADLLKLYIYGYTYRYRSSRFMEDMCHHNNEIMWLINCLTPDFKTICDFRRDNVEPIKKAFNEFVDFCLERGLATGNLVAIDGSKFKADNSKSNNYTLARIQRKIEFSEAKIKEHFDLMDHYDENDLDASVFAREENEAALEKWIQKKAELEGFRDKINSGEVSQISLTDPESRRMKTKDGYVVGYNVQTAVDSENKLILAYDVTNEGNDRNQLGHMALLAKETLGVEELDVVADKGYHKGGELAKCLDNNVTPYVPAQKSGLSQKDGVPAAGFSREDFEYDEENDLYVCPAGKVLKRSGEKLDKRTNNRFFIYHCKDCKDCPFMSKCTRSKNGRSIYRPEHYKALKKVENLVRDNLDVIHRRKELVEHPYGIVKFSFGYSHLLLRGLKKVKGEFGLTFLVYNMRRVVNILGVKAFREELREWKTV